MRSAACMLACLALSGCASLPPNQLHVPFGAGRCFAFCRIVILISPAQCADLEGPIDERATTTTPDAP
jgi:hypothetical protein